MSTIRISPPSDGLPDARVYVGRLAIWLPPALLGEFGRRLLAVVSSDHSNPASVEWLAEGVRCRLFACRILDEVLVSAQGIVDVSLDLDTAYRLGAACAAYTMEDAA